jgi:hypothetical protein
LKIAPVHIFLLKYIFIVHRVHNKPAKSKTLEEEIGANSKAPKNAKPWFCGRYACARGSMSFISLSMSNGSNDEEYGT